MAGQRVTAVRLEYLDHDRGHWCNQCRLATGMRVWVVVWWQSWMHVQARLWCPECGGRDVTVAHDARHC